MKRLAMHVQPFVMQQRAVDEEGNEHFFSLEEMPLFVAEHLPEEVIMTGNKAYAKRFAEKAMKEQQTRYNKVKTKFTF